MNERRRIIFLFFILIFMRCIFIIIILVFLVKIGLVSELTCQVFSNGILP